MKPSIHVGIRAAVLLLVALQVAVAQEEPVVPEARKPAPTASEAVAREIEAYDAARQQFFERYRKAQDDAERQTLYREHYPKDSEYADRIMVAVRKQPSDAAVLEGVLWVLPRGAPAQRDECIGILAAHHLKDPKMAEACGTLGHVNSVQAEELLRRLMKDSPHHEVRGQATFALAGKLNQQGQMLAGAGKDGLPGRIREWLGEEVVASLEKRGAPAIRAEAEKLFDLVASTYDDVEERSGRTLAAASKAELFEIRNLSIGKVAPEIAGKDLDGVAFKLSDYRGKVVVLDFWGDW